MAMLPNAVRISFPTLVAPKGIVDEKGVEGPKKYSIRIMIRKDDEANLTAIRQMIAVAKEKGKSKWGGKVPLKMMILGGDGGQEMRDGDLEQESNGGTCGPEFAGHYFFSANAAEKSPPQIFKRIPVSMRQPGGAPIEPCSAEEIYPGCYVAVDINCYPYSVTSKGIAAGLNAVVFVKHGERLDGRTSAITAFKAFDDSSIKDDDDDVIQGPGVADQGDF